MYISKIILDNKKVKTILSTQTPQLIHGYMKTHFPNEFPLWRIEPNERTMLLLTENIPDLTDFIEQFGVCAKTIPYTIPEEVKEGQVWQYRIKARPHKKCKGRSYGLKTREEKKDWLKDKLTGVGFDVKTMEIIQDKPMKFKHRKGDVQDIVLANVTYDGFVTITDVEKAREALTKAIGGKSTYGLGMLTLAKI